MPIRDRFALALVAICVGVLALLGGVASGGAPTRPLDAVALWLASILQLGLVLTWVLIPRLPKWIVAGWGLILFAAGIGVTIVGPVMSGRVPPEVGAPAGTPFLWGLAGLVVVGILTMLASVAHTSEKAAL